MSLNRSWKIKPSPLGGRGIFAIRTIESGEVLLYDQPLIIGPSNRKESSSAEEISYCVMCYTTLKNSESKCLSGCSMLICENCKNGEKHRRECEILQKWKPTSSQCIRTLVLGMFEPCDEIAMQELSECFENFPKDEKTINFFENLLEILNINAFSVKTHSVSEPNALRGLYPLVAILNHNCTPNCSVFVDRHKNMCVRTTKRVENGSELFISYTNILWNTFTRRTVLSLSKGFFCNCLRCLDPTENGSYLSALFCQTKDCSGWLLPEQMEARKTNWICLKCGTKNSLAEIASIYKNLSFIFESMRSKSLDERLNSLLKICPETNQYVIETKLEIVLKFKFTLDVSEDSCIKIFSYGNDVLNVLDTLRTGNCSQRIALLKEMENIRSLIKTLNKNFST